MRVSSQLCDPAVHGAAITMARRFVWIIQAVLREEERIGALREAYTVAREELEAVQASEKSEWRMVGHRNSRIGRGAASPKGVSMSPATMFAVGILIITVLYFRDIKKGE